MKFYMTPGSCSTAIHILLEELEEVFEAHIVNLPAGDHFKPDYVALNPKSTIPTLVRRDGSVLTEMIAIGFWLGKSQPRAGLWPTDLEAETRAIETMAYVVNTVHGQGFARIFATPSFAGTASDLDKVKTLGRDIVTQGFAILDKVLAGRDYVADTFSAADPFLFYVEFWADKTQIPLPPNVAAHYRRLLERRAVQQVLREEGYNTATLGTAARILN
ncbi:glutathione S-transferase family protein [Xanthobacter agilis]|nr:glutathione S-transferase C-terminal domain-containing protein [Xanthobacter agilis]